MRNNAYVRCVQMLLEGVIVGVSLFLAIQIRYAGHVPRDQTAQFWVVLLPVIAGQLITNIFFGAHRIQWRYVSIKDASVLIKAYVAFSAFLLLLRFGLPEQWSVLRIPGSVITIALLLSVQGALGIRLARRLLYEYRSSQVEEQRTNGPRKLLLVGAGVLGSTVAKEMSKRPGIKIVGFVDDDPRKVGTIVAGIRVLGQTTLLPELVHHGEVDDVLVCIAPNGRHSVSRLWALLERLPIRSRIVPTLDEILDADDSVSVAGARNNHGSNGHGGQAVTKAEPAPPRKSVIRGKNILITGGAGFIGSSLAERLVDQNQVVLLDRFFDNQPIRFTELRRHPNVQLVEADIMKGDGLFQHAAQADIVVHAAAIVGVGRVCSYPRETLETNFVGTSRVLQAIEKNPHIERLVYFSTSEVFGVNSFRVHENTPAAVGPAAEARWSYAIAKLAGEHLVKSYHREVGLPTATVRPFNIFGPRRLGSYAIREFVLAALTGEPLEIHGDGSQIRSWCYIEDFCDALIEMMARLEAVGEDFNIGNPRNTLTILRLAEKIIELTDSESEINFVTTEIPDIEIRVPSLEKAHRVLDYEPQFDLDRALGLTIDWYRQNLTALTNRAARAVGTL